MDRHLYDRGLAKRRQVLGDAHVDRALADVADFNRDFQRFVTEYCLRAVLGQIAIYCGIPVGADCFQIADTILSASKGK